LSHPEIADRTCEECIFWSWNDSGKGMGTKKNLRAGKPYPRGNAPPPCYKCPKSRDGKPNPAAELLPQNWRAYRHFQQVKVDTTGVLPRDRIVIRNCAVIQQVLDQLERVHRIAMQAMLGMHGNSGGGKGK
jgi:hypothetical protein